MNRRFTERRQPATGRCSCFCCGGVKQRNELAADGTPEKRCPRCVEAGCVPTYADFWKRGPDCPVRKHAHKAAWNRAPRKEKAS